MKSSRSLALEALLAWNNRPEPLDTILTQLFLDNKLADQRDNQFIMALIYGVLRWRGYLDAIMAGFSTHPLSKMKPITREALRLGLYQVIFMDRVPDSAAINETVQILKEAKQPKWLTGFVNGVLRTAVRQKEDLPSINQDAVLKSHPGWLVRRWQGVYGKERTGVICEANNQQPVLSLRINTSQINVADYMDLLKRNDISFLPGLYSPDAVLLPGYRGIVAGLPGYDQGFFQVQDEAAQLVCNLLGPFLPGAYLDGCAGLGGKSMHLAQLIHPEASLLAVEPSAKRIALFKENMERMQLGSVEAYDGTLQAFSNQTTEKYQGILLDAPCSGLGVIRRHPEIRWARAKKDLVRYQAGQLELLACAAPLMADGGVLVYATCSIDPKENEEVVTSFLNDFPQFHLSDSREFLPTQARILVDDSGFFKTTPEQGLDGFFAARLKRVVSKI